MRGELNISEYTDRSSGSLLGIGTIMEIFTEVLLEDLATKSTILIGRN